MKTLGLDVHKRFAQAAIIDGTTGEITEGLRFDCTPEAIRAFCSERIAREDQVALESTTSCWAVSAILRDYCDRVIVSNPMRTKLIAQSKKKCDRVDALTLAELLAAGYLPGVWEPDPETRQRREISSRKASLVQDRTAVKNRIHAVLAQRLISHDDLFSKGGRKFLNEVTLDETGRLCVDSDLRLLDHVEKEIAAIEAVIVRIASADQDARLLVTLPGFDFAGAVGVIAGAGDISRFPDGDHFAAYFGLVPSNHQSADRAYHGPITKQGRSHVRWIFCQAGQHLAHNKGPLGHFFRRLAKKKGHNIAVVACARKLAVIAWHMLTKHEPYRYADPANVTAKLARIRIRATGVRRKSGNPKGSGRHPAYGSGVGSKRTKSLDQVLAGEGLPARSVPPPGETRFLKREGLEADVAALVGPKSRLRRAGKPAVPGSNEAQASKERR